jgi:hypothetical protein
MTRQVMNQYLKKPKIITQDVCRTCFGDMTRAHSKGRIVTEETKQKNREITNKLFQDPKFRKKHSEGQKRRYLRKEEIDKKREIGRKAWSDPEFVIKKSEEFKNMWNDPVFRKYKSKEASNRLKEYWKDPEYRKKMTNVAKETWNSKDKRKAQSIKCKERLKGKNPFNLYGMKPTKPEKELFKIVKKMFSDAQQGKSIETEISRRYPDILIESKKLIIEYDGSRWHPLKEDKKRDKELKKVGYTVIHYRDYIPSANEIKRDVFNLSI